MPDKITCTSCGKTDVPDWNGKEQCITCARDAVLGSDHTDLSELREEVFDVLNYYEIDASEVSFGTAYIDSTEANKLTGKILHLFQQYAQPPVVADEELDGILKKYGQQMQYEQLRLASVGSEDKATINSVKRNTALYTAEAKAALLQREQRLVAEARVDELERALEPRNGRAVFKVPAVYIRDRVAQLRHNTNTGKEE